jgi:hypothetical protein
VGLAATGTAANMPLQCLQLCGRHDVQTCHQARLGIWGEVAMGVE